MKCDCLDGGHNDGTGTCLCGGAIERLRSTAPTAIMAVTVRRNAAGGGWFVIVKTADRTEHVVGNRSGGVDWPIIDPTQLQAEVARWTARLVLGREYE